MGVMNRVVDPIVYARRRARLAGLQGSDAVRRAAARLSGRPVPPKRNYTTWQTTSHPWVRQNFVDGRWVEVERGENIEHPYYSMYNTPEYKKMQRNQKRRNRRAKLKGFFSR